MTLQNGVYVFPIFSPISNIWPSTNLNDTFGMFSMWLIKIILLKYTGGVQIIGRNLRFFGYFVTKTKNNTEKKYPKIQG